MRDTADVSHSTGGRAQGRVKDQVQGRVEMAPEHRELLDHVMDKWSFSVLNEVCEHPVRFNELRRAIPAITQRSLTSTLRRLERNGLVDRVVISTRPLTVQYCITELGLTLRKPMYALIAWSKDQMPVVQAARVRFDVIEDTPEPVSAAAGEATR